jgi:prepilin-type processing-associated H-X9-DG protein
MKHLSLGIIFATLLAIVVVSCRQGEKGAPGPAGASAQLLPYKDGSITGTLTGTSQLKDEDFTQTLNFQYFKGPADNVNSIINDDGDEDAYIITRYDSTGSSYIKLEFSLDSTLNQSGGYDPYIYNTYVTIVSTKKTANSNNAFYFGTCDDYSSPFDVNSVYLSDYSSGGNNNITYDNLVLNKTTGKISFDYSIEITYYNNSTGNYAYLDGSVSVTPYNVSYRQGAAQ